MKAYEEEFGSLNDALETHGHRNIDEYKAHRKGWVDALNWVIGKGEKLDFFPTHDFVMDIKKEELGGG